MDPYHERSSRAGREHKRVHSLQSLPKREIQRSTSIENYKYNPSHQSLIQKFTTNRQAWIQGENQINAHRKALEEVLLCEGVKPNLSTHSIYTLKSLPAIPDNLNTLIESLEVSQSSFEDLAHQIYSKSLQEKDGKIEALKKNLKSLSQQRNDLSQMVLTMESRNDVKMDKLRVPRKTIRKIIEKPESVDIKGMQRIIHFANILDTSEKSASVLINEIRMNMQSDLAIYFTLDEFSNKWNGKLYNRELQIDANRSVLTIAASSKRIVIAKPEDSCFDAKLEEAINVKAKTMAVGPVLDHTSKVLGVLVLVYKHFEVPKTFSSMLDIFGLFAWKSRYENEIKDKAERFNRSVRSVLEMFNCKNYSEFEKIGESLVVNVLPVRRARLLFSDRNTTKLYSKYSENQLEVYPNQKGIAGWLVNNLKGQIVNDVNKDSRFVKAVDDPFSSHTSNLIGTAFGRQKNTIADGVIIGIDCLYGHFSLHDLDLLELLSELLKNALDYLNTRLNLKSFSNSFHSLSHGIDELGTDIDKRTRSFSYVQSQLDLIISHAKI